MSPEISASRAMLFKELDKLDTQIKELQAFKDWVHKYLDVHGVPHHPPGIHGNSGCRIGDRMDWLIDKITKLEKVRVLSATLVNQCIDGHMSADHPDDLSMLLDLKQKLHEAML